MDPRATPSVAGAMAFEARSTTSKIFRSSSAIYAGAAGSCVGELPNGRNDGAECVCDADSNTIRNCVVQSSAAWSNATWGGAALYIGGSTGTSGNDNNVVAGNLIGDPAGVHRAYAGVLLAGTSAAVANTGNVIHGNDVVNFRVQGISVSSFSTGTVVRRNRIWMTHPGQAQGGAAEIFTHGQSALAIPPSDWAALAQAMARLTQDAELRRRLGEHARAVTVERFGRYRLGRDAVAAMRELLPGQRSGDSP